MKIMRMLCKQTKDFNAKLLEAVPDNINQHRMQRLIGHPTLMKELISQLGRDYCWSEQKDGSIEFTIPSLGFSGETWERDLQDWCIINQQLRDELLAESFPVTKNLRRNIVVFPGRYFPGAERYLRRIRAFAMGRTLEYVDVEMACLIRKRLYKDDILDMGLQTILAMSCDGYYVISQNPKRDYPTLSRGKEDDDTNRLSSHLGFAFMLPN